MNNLTIAADLYVGKGKWYFYEFTTPISRGTGCLFNMSFMLVSIL